MPPPNTPQDISISDLNLTAEQYNQLLQQTGNDPPNSPATSQNVSPRATRVRYTSLNQQVAEAPESAATSSSLNFPNGVDFRALGYIGPVDENLMCPICHAPLVDPVDTECDHTFCRSCIRQALSHSEICPIDRYPLVRQASLSRSHKIVINQLDALLVKCICCESPIPRSMLSNHVERYCKDALVKCPGKTCDEVVKRELSDKGCLHYDVTCPDCEEVSQEISMRNHRERLCKERQKECGHCSAEILRCKESEHMAECPDVMASCQWAEYGCQHESKRKDLQDHAAECSFRVVGPMADMLKKEINALQSEVRALTEKDQIQERRIKFLESGQKDTYRPLDYPEMSSHAVTLPDSATAEPLDSANEYLLSLVEAQENRVSQLSAGMTDLEAKQTMMLFNETIPIKNELAEIRSTQQVVSMHVRWLLNFRRQENQKRYVGGGGGPGSNGGSDGGASSGDLPLPRRLSDSNTRDIMTRL
jgi:TNF receptor-associated factor 5